MSSKTRGSNHSPVCICGCRKQCKRRPACWRTDFPYLFSEIFSKGTRSQHEAHAACQAATSSAQIKMYLRANPHSGPLQNTRPRRICISLRVLCHCRFSSECPYHVCWGMCSTEAPRADCHNSFYLHCCWKIYRICSGSQVRESKTYSNSSIIKTQPTMPMPSGYLGQSIAVL